MRWFKPWPAKRRLVESAPWGGEVVDVDLYLAQAWAELGDRQTQLARQLKLQRAEWRINHDAGLIEFERTDGVLARAPVQVVGAWDPRSHQFAWGWAAPGVSPRMRAAAERTRWFGDKHGLSEFTGRSLPADEREAWRLAAVAMKVNAAVGVYRAPTDKGAVFLTLGELNVQPTPQF